MGLTRLASIINLYQKFILPYVKKYGAVHLKGSSFCASMFKNTKSKKYLATMKNCELSVRNNNYKFLEPFSFLHSIITWNRGQDNDFKLSPSLVLDRTSFSGKLQTPSDSQLLDLKKVGIKNWEFLKSDYNKFHQTVLWNLNNLEKGKSKLLYMVCN